jgi:hypothetical protein
MKQSGLGDRLLVGGFDVSADIGGISALSFPSDVLDVTALPSEARERIYGLADVSITFTGYWDAGAGRLHAAAADHRTPGLRVVTYLRGAGLGRPAAGAVVRQVNYDWTREAGGALSGTIQCQGAAGYGLDWGVQLTAGVSTLASAGALTGIDNGAASSTGWSAYLQVVGLTSGTPTVVVEQSDDNGGADPWAALSGASFTGLVAPGGYALRSATPTAAVKRWVRARATGTFSGLQFALVFSREPVVL